MKNKKKKIQPIVYGTTLAIALSLMMPSQSFAEETNRVSEDQVSQESQQATEDIPMIKVEVTDIKEKKKPEPVVVKNKEEGEDDYIVTDSSTGSKSNVATKDVPQSIVVIGEKVMKEQNNRTINDALANVAGVTSYLSSTDAMDTSVNGVNSTFMIRGFQAQTVTDGLVDSNSSGWLGNVEKVEVLEGPSSVLYGSGQPGGIINIVTKKPLPDYSLTLGQSFGSWGTRDSSLDQSIPLTEDKKWLSRVILDQENKGYFQNNNLYEKKFNGSVMIQGKPDDATTYTLQTVFNDYNEPGGNVGLLPYAYDLGGGDLLSSTGLVLPYNGNYTNPNFRTYYIGRSILGKVEHKVNDTWTVNSTVKYSKQSFDIHSMSGYTISEGDPGLFERYIAAFTKQDTLAVDTNGNAKFKALGLQHNAVIGVNWSRTVNDTSQTVGIPSNPYIDPFNPVFADQPTFIIGTSSIKYADYSSNLYLSDIITLSPKLKVSTGFSHSQFKEEATSGLDSQSEQGNTMRLGLTYETTPSTTWFTGYSTSYSPNGIGTDLNGNKFNMKPTTGVQVEGGVKFDVSSRASVTMSVFNIDYKNLADSFELNGVDVSTVTGKQNNRGFDINANYVIKPGWNMLLSYAYLNAKIVEDNAYPERVGNRPIGSPQNSVRLWSTYEFQEGAKKGLGFGGGLTYVSKRATYDDNRFWMDGYMTVDAVVYYSKKDWNYKLNLYNLTNKKYWQSGNMLGVYAGNPRSFTVTIERKL